jgi:DUF1680 family protein
MNQHKNQLLSAAVLLMSSCAASAQPSTVSGPHLQAEPFPLSQVRLLDGPFKHAQEMDLRYLLALDPDRFLYNFRVNAGLPAGTEFYGGWEAPTSELRGHANGHYLSASSLMYASTGNPELKRRIDHLVAELAKCQAALPARGSHPGYLAAFPESFYDRVDQRQSVWAPWYTMHKLMAGLLDAYENGRNAQALAVVTALGNWVKFRVDRLPVDQFQASLNNEHGGMNEVMANLAAVTGNPEFLRIAQAFNHQAVFAPLARGEDQLDGLHANTQIPKIIGAAREYELAGNPTYRSIAEFFWQRVALDRSFVFGGNSDAEHFFPVHEEARHLTQTTAETCNTYNMLKLTRHIFAWNPSAGSMDFYERGLYNDILASQDPATGMMIYFLALEPGWRKLYNTPDQTFWCCTGTGMENHAKYGDTIFFHGDRSLYVNLFIPAELQWPEKGVTIRQDTRFPEDDRSRLTIRAAKPVELAIKIRHPYWCAQPEVKINGAAAAGTSEESYLVFDRTWQSGDTLELRLPMELHAEPMPDDPSLVALMYGPIVLAGDLGGEGLTDKPTEIAGAFPVARIPEAIPLVPGLVATAADLLAHVRPVPGNPLTFVTEGIGRPHDVILMPLYRMVHDRYTVYWRLYDDSGWQRHFAAAGPEEARRQAAQARLLDEVWACWAGSETAHHLQAEQSRAVGLDNFLFREAAHGAFSWTLKAAAGQPMTLCVGYVGVDSPAFDIFVEGRKIAEERITRTRGEKGRTTTVVKTYEVPAALSAGKNTVEIRFAGQGDTGTARVIFCELSRTAPQTPG